MPHSKTDGWDKYEADVLSAVLSYRVASLRLCLSDNVEALVVALSSVLQFSAKVGFENSLVGGPPGLT